MSRRTTAPQRRRARPFWFGEPDTVRPAWRRYLPAVLAFAVAAVVFGVGGFLVGRPSEEVRAVEDLRASDAARDKVQIEELTELARATRDALSPVAIALGQSSATAEEIAEWQRIVADAAKSFDDPPSGATATNVARGSLAAAVDQLAVAVDTYQRSLTGGTALRDLAVRQRDITVTTWSVGATQLDQINIDAGFGHQHVFLEGDPHTGAFTPDGAPEGTGGG